jgi:hypothetical protein
LDSAVKDHCGWGHLTSTVTDVVCVPIAELAMTIIPEAVQCSIIKKCTDVIVSTRHLTHATIPHIHGGWGHFIRSLADGVRVPITELAIIITPETVQRAIVQDHTGVTVSTRHLKHATTPHIHGG